MRRTRLALQLDTHDAGLNPGSWDWHSLLDLRPDEDVVVIDEEDLGPLQPKLCDWCGERVKPVETRCRLCLAVAGAG